MTSLPDSTKIKPFTKARVMRDIQELVQHPEPGMTVHFNEKDYTKLCLILSPLQGELQGLRLHFTGHIPDNFPLVPPAISNSTKMDHPNVFGKWICCDILKDEDEMRYYRSGGYTGGFTPAYSLQGIFMQVASFFSDIRVEQSGGNVYNMESRIGFTAAERRNVPSTVSSRYLHALREALPFSCSCCGYGEGIAHTLPGAYTEMKPSRRSNRRIDQTAERVDAVVQMVDEDMMDACYLLTLPTDVMLDILDCLTDNTDVLRFAKAFPPVAELIATNNIIAKREIRCFCLKKVASETILGVGLAWDAAEKSFTSDFDYLSIEAYDVMGVRLGVRRSALDHWLPLAINASHFYKSRAEIATRLLALETVVRSSLRTPPPASPIGYRVLCTFANNIVIRLMGAYDSSLKGVAAEQTIMHASERALSDYFSLIHLLISIAAGRQDVTKAAETDLRNFINDPKKRLKASTPNLGELIVQMLMVPSVPWSALRKPLLEEAFARNVVWSLDVAQGKGYAGLAFLEKTPIDKWRLQTTFAASRTSLRLLMFQYLFLQKIRQVTTPGAQGATPLLKLKDAIDRRYGLPPPELPGQLVVAIKEIYQVDNFAAFSVRLNLPAPSMSWMTQYLRDRVAQSVKQGYHITPLSIGALQSVRARDDAAFAAANKHIRAANAPVRIPSFFPNNRSGGENRGGYRGSSRGSNRGGSNRGGFRGTNGRRETTRGTTGCGAVGCPICNPR